MINNQIYMSPAPAPVHQLILGEIHAQLHQFVKKHDSGKVLVAPCDVYLNRKNAYQPDIIFISNDKLHNLKGNGFHGAPDLVIEILSPATWRFDKEDKKDEYERSGVREYWMVDPADKSTEGFFLINNEFQPLSSEKGKIVFRLFDFTLSF